MEHYTSKQDFQEGDTGEDVLEELLDKAYRQNFKSPLRRALAVHFSSYSGLLEHQCTGPQRDDL